ncbi:uncharacterized protein LOC129720089 [Wyeomyia smithii]|uniref:uncharacterized protein LOC129720089 n=1 Tax=Wyeomyia smithii TaxID=174621 RepID=UPI002467BE51|nr:uncharacterized protein LOC129720089 [Wyeomyia smithii]
MDSFQHSSVTSCNMAVGLEELLSRFWSCEEIGYPTNYSPEELRCEEQFVQTVERGSDGRYSVSLPKKEGALARIGESSDIAFRRLLGLERRLLKDVELRQQYDQFMEEYLYLGHMRKVETRSLEQVTHFYLPHHPVVKQESTTSKVIILGSRTKQFMLVSDVEKMFRQIEINASDRPLQSILWRTDNSKNVETYELTTVTYGTRPAPFLETRTRNQLAMDERAQL